MLKEIKFTLKDGSVRDFSQEAHGADFEILASQFSDGNKDIVERSETRVEAELASVEAPEQPPQDNEHVAEGAERFPEADTVVPDAGIGKSDGTSV